MKKNSTNASVKVSEIEFNNGKKINIDEEDIVIFVGANNVGKSRILKEIRNDLFHHTSTNKILIKNIQYKNENFDNNKILKILSENFLKEENGNYNVYLDENTCFQVSGSGFMPELSSPYLLYKIFYNFLSTESRLKFTLPLRENSIKDPFSFKIIRKLEENEDKMNILNDNLFKIFDKKIEVYDLDENFFGKSYKFGSKEEIDDISQSNSRKAKQKLKKLENLHEHGDGIRSAVAILASLIVSTQSIFLIDEPEVFLHPPQAKSLGNILVKLTKGKQCFISTHSIDFIKGLLESNSERIKIVKINRNDNYNTFNILENGSVQEITNNNSLKYSNILNGLFYKKVVLCEDESDCKFYSFILENINPSIYQDTLFCGVGGKDRFKIIIPLLKKLNIEWCVIADLDLINNKAKLEDLMNAVQVNEYNKIESEHKKFLELYPKENSKIIKNRQNIKSEIEKILDSDDSENITKEESEKIKLVIKDYSKFEMLKQEGKCSIKNKECLKNYNSIIEKLSFLKIHLVEVGELEKFIPEIKLKGNRWVEEVLKKHVDIKDKKYQKVIQFLKEIFNL
jgi:putative ATPase